MTSGMLTLGQVRDVCLQIRAWREQGELDRAAYWSRRLRAEPARCSVHDCASPPLPDRPWCDEHRMVRLREPARRRRPTPEQRMGDILDLIRTHPGISDSEIGRRIGLGAWMVGRYRQQAGIPVYWRRTERPLGRRRA